MRKGWYVHVTVDLFLASSRLEEWNEHKSSFGCTGQKKGEEEMSAKGQKPRDKAVMMPVP